MHANMDHFWPDNSEMHRLPGASSEPSDLGWTKGWKILKALEALFPAVYGSMG